MEKGKKLWKIAGKYPIYLAFVLLFIVLAAASDSFLSVGNILNVFKQSCVIGIVAVGMTFVIGTGGIDLSVGAIVAISACIASSMSLQDTNTPLWAAYLIGILAGALCGAFSGIFISLFHMPEFIATLATMTIARGITYVYTDGRPVTGMTKAYSYIGKGTIGIVPVAVVIYAVIVVIGFFLLRYTKFGRYVLAIGGNEKCAIVSGINTKLVKFSCYVLSGITSACAGILLSSRIQTGQPAGGMGYELDAITAVVIGGGSLAGGKGSVIGCVVGVLIINFLTNGLNLLNISSYYQEIIKGIIILLAVLSDREK